MSTIAPPGLVFARDLEIDDWLDRLVGASVDQIRERFGLGRTQAYRRLQVLQDHGLVRRRHLSAILPPLYTVRSRSLRIASTEHAHALTELVVSIETSGGEIATELELRRERNPQPALSCRLTVKQLATMRSCPRVPDAAELLGSGGLRAFEVELSSKGRARRAAVLAAYATSAYESVTWIAPDPQLRVLINREVAEHGLVGFMEVRDAL
jgi:DNA-binding transcriptional ArsR family regulator